MVAHSHFTMSSNTITIHGLGSNVSYETLIDSLVEKECRPPCALPFSALLGQRRVHLADATEKVLELEPGISSVPSCISICLPVALCLVDALTQERGMS